MNTNGISIIEVILSMRLSNVISIIKIRFQIFFNEIHLFIEIHIELIKIMQKEIN